jgi:hypothetical protein
MLVGPLSSVFTFLRTSFTSSFFRFGFNNGLWLGFNNGLWLGFNNGLWLGFNNGLWLGFNNGLWLTT